MHEFLPITRVCCNIVCPTACVVVNITIALIFYCRNFTMLLTPNYSDNTVPFTPYDCEYYCTVDSLWSWTLLYWWYLFSPAQELEHQYSPSNWSPYSSKEEIVEAFIKTCTEQVTTCRGALAWETHPIQQDGEDTLYLISVDGEISL